MSDERLQEIGTYLGLMLALGRPENRLIWEYIVVVAGQLEYLAVAILWVHDGKRVPWPEFEERMTLGQAARQLEKQQLFPPATIQLLMAVAQLRNAVVHRRLVEGVTLVAEYRGRQVFDDPEVLEMFVEDATRLTNELNEWLNVHHRGQLPEQS